jgi:type II secretory pathway pseudopilin PulG
MAVNEKGFSLVEMLVATLILIVAMGVAVQLFVQGNAAYVTQRAFDDARSNASAALDMTVRLLRSAQTIAPDPDGNLALDSVRVIADWNPKDGDTNDAYENVLFTTAGGTLFKQEPADAGPIAFADRIASITFNYLTPAGVPVAAPWAVSQAQLGMVGIRVQTTPVNGTPVVMNSSASVRRRE